MKLERGPFAVEAYDDSPTITLWLGREPVFSLDHNEARWLQALALPAAIARSAPAPEKPSEPPETLDGQIPGQTTIDEALAEA